MRRPIRLMLAAAAVLVASLSAEVITTADFKVGPDWTK